MTGLVDIIPGPANRAFSATVVAVESVVATIEGSVITTVEWSVVSIVAVVAIKGTIVVVTIVAIERSVVTIVTVSVVSTEGNGLTLAVVPVVVIVVALWSVVGLIPELSAIDSVPVVTGHTQMAASS